MDWIDWLLLLIFGIVIAVLLYDVVCSLVALRTPPDAWTETNKTCGFPKQRKR